MAEHLRDFAHVDADRRQDSAGADSLAQSLLACRVGGDAVRSANTADSVWYALVSDRIRFHSSPARYSNPRRCRTVDRPATPLGRGFFRRGPDRAARAAPARKRIRLNSTHTFT